MAIIACASVKSIIRNHVELARVRIVCEDVAGVDYRLLLAVIEGSEEGGDVVVEILGIVSTDEHWVREPAFVEVPCSLDCDCVV